MSSPPLCSVDDLAVPIGIQHDVGPVPSAHRLIVLDSRNSRRRPRPTPTGSGCVPAGSVVFTNLGVVDRGRLVSLASGLSGARAPTYKRIARPVTRAQGVRCLHGARTVLSSRSFSRAGSKISSRWASARRGAGESRWHATSPVHPVAVTVHERVDGERPLLSARSRLSFELAGGSMKPSQSASWRTRFAGCAASIVEGCSVGEIRLNLAGWCPPHDRVPRRFRRLGVGIFSSNGGLKFQ